MSLKIACIHCGFVFEDEDMEVCPICGTELGQEWDPSLLKSFVVTELTPEQAEVVAKLLHKKSNEILSELASDGCIGLDDLTPAQVEAYAKALNDAGIKFAVETPEQKAVRVQEQLKARAANDAARAADLSASAEASARARAEAEAKAKEAEAVKAGRLAEAKQAEAKEVAAKAAADAAAKQAQAATEAEKARLAAEESKAANAAKAQADAARQLELEKAKAASEAQIKIAEAQAAAAIAAEKTKQMELEAAEAKKKHRRKILKWGCGIILFFILGFIALCVFAMIEAQKDEEEKARIAAVELERKQIAAKKAEAERLAAARKAEAERLAAARKAEAERLAAARKAEAERLAAARKAEAERLAATRKAEAERLAAAKKAQLEKLMQDMIQSREVWLATDKEAQQAAEHVKEADLEYPTISDVEAAVRCADIEALATMKKNGFSRWQDPRLILAAAKTPFVFNLMVIREFGGDVNAKGVDGKTVLMQVVDSSNRIEMIRYLVENGADVNVQYPDDTTILQKEVTAPGNLEIVTYFIKHGAEISVKESGGVTLLMKACAQPGNLDMVKTLVANGASVKDQDDDGRTALFYAVGLADNLPVIRHLVGHGADVNAADGHQKTVLMYAAGVSGNLTTVKYLVSQGADMTLRDDAYKAVYVYASEKGDHAIMNYLSRQGAGVRQLEEYQSHVKRLAAERRMFESSHVSTWQLPNGVSLEMVGCSTGSFMMGSPSNESGRDDDEKQHRVTLTKPFLIGKYEVTQAQYEAVMENNPSKFKGSDRPVEQISWTEAMAFCDELNALTEGKRPAGYKFSLPTEAQWEYACRAGSTGAYVGDLDSMGWYNDNSGNRTHDVGQKRSNAWGIYDMHGNVWEWCRDWYGKYTGDAVDPVGPLSGSSRVIRGGCWGNSARDCRSAHRGYCVPGGRGSGLGFRVALVPIQ